VVPLTSLLKAAGVDTELKKPTGNDPKNKHGEMHFAVIVQGSDGYFTVFSIGELMADLANRPVLIALDVDGKSWPATEAPVKLIVPDDQKPARWVHSVQSISVIKVELPATQPAK
jgi:Oxidoreductase molybdopterin binding domain